MKGNKKHTIVNRLIRSFFASVLAPTICIVLLVVIVFYNNSTAKAQQEMESSLSLITNNISCYTNELNDITTTPYYHSYFVSSKPMDPSSADYLSDLNGFQTEMRSLLNLTSYSRNDILDLLVWSDDHYLYYTLYNQTLYFSSSFDIKKQGWYQKALSSSERAVYASNYSKNKADGKLSGSSFYVVRSIKNPMNTKQKNLIILNVSTSYFDSQFQKLNLPYQTLVVITNDENGVIYSSTPVSSDTLQSITTRNVYQDNGVRWEALTEQIPKSGLKVHIVYSLNDVWRQTVSLIASILIISLAGILMAVVLFQYFNKWIAKSAKTITSTFKDLESGDLSARCPEVEVREFNDIGHSVNKVIMRLEEKIKTEYLLTIHQKTVQLSALQSQIQPHFLINTLYCFIALNQIGQKEKLTTAFYQLANLLRYVLGKEQLTTLGQELDFLQNYLSLQKLRFEDRLEYTVECPDELKKLPIPRLLLQPIVENSVVHGIEPCEHPCYCNIKISLRDGILTMKVIDNGVGLAAAANPEKSNLIGLNNTNERLKLWNQAAVFSITSGETTQAVITVPIEGENEHIDC